MIVCKNGCALYLNASSAVCLVVMVNTLYDPIFKSPMVACRAVLSAAVCCIMFITSREEADATHSKKQSCE